MLLLNRKPLTNTLKRRIFMAEKAVELITLEEAILKSHSMKKNTFIWRTKEDIFGCVLSEEYGFNCIGVMWGRRTYAYNCYVAVDSLPYSADNDTFFVGTNHNNGYFVSLQELRKAHPRLFNVKGEFKTLLTLW